MPSESVRAIVAACLDREAVSLIYAAKTGLQEFVFSPSALVRSRGRYHLRGHRAEGRDALGARIDDRYVDVVPARAVEAWRTWDAPFVGLDNDDDWHAFEERVFVLSPELSEAEKTLLRARVRHRRHWQAQGPKAACADALRASGTLRATMLAARRHFGAGLGDRG